jgi:hypothetical protein
MQPNTRVALALSTVLLLAGCAKSETAATDTVAANAAPMPAPAAPAPAPLALADLAGTWNMRTVPASGTDTVPTNVVVTAGADAASWSMKLPSGETTKVEPVVAGDSVVLTSGTFGSIRRKGAKVSTVSTLRLQEGKLVGTTIAHYKNAGADSVLRMTAVATKAP